MYRRAIGLLSALFISGCVSALPPPSRQELNAALNYAPLSHRTRELIEEDTESRFSKLVGKHIDFDTPEVMRESYKVRIYDRQERTWTCISLPYKFRPLNKYAIKYVCDTAGPEHALAAIKALRNTHINAAIANYLGGKSDSKHARHTLEKQRATLCSLLHVTRSQAAYNRGRYDTDVCRTLGETDWTPFGVTISLDAELLENDSINYIEDIYAHELSHAIVADDDGFFGRIIHSIHTDTQDEERISETTANVVQDLFCEYNHHRTHTPRNQACPPPPIESIKKLYNPGDDFIAHDIICTRYSDYPYDKTQLKMKIRKIMNTIGILEHLKLLREYHTINRIDEVYTHCVSHPHCSAQDIRALLDND